MAACLMHVCDCKTKSTKITPKSWEKFVNCSRDWLKLTEYSGIEKDVAKKAVSRYHIELNSADIPPVPEDASYHRDCYQRYTCKSKIERQLKKQIQDQKNASTCESQSESNDDSTETPCKKMLRSSTSLGPGSSQSHILPKKCIICRAEKMKSDPSSRKRCIEKLSQCQTLEAGRLIEAAQIKKDQVLLLHLENVDPVAAEVRYHHSCYASYTRFLRKRAPQSSTDTSFSESFSHFCSDFVVPRIVRDKEIFRMTTLTGKFKEYIRKIEGWDAQNYRTASLKQRLKKAHPELMFLKSSKRSDSDLVFVDTLSAVDVIEDKVSLEEQFDGDTTESETDEDGVDTQPHPTKSKSPGVELRDLFASAMYLQEVISSHPPAFQQWPPIAEDFTEEAVKQCIPEILVKFLAWITGESNDPFVENIDKKRLLKIQSICQDILYFSSRGATHMPKHMALAMAIRHMTGSASVIDLLNGLGHCVANSMVLEHDTALAKVQEKKGPLALPSFIKQNEFSTLVWDNNDFGEETLTGRGTTHNTNGIIIQRTLSDSMEISEPEHIRLDRTRKRSLEAPSSDITPFRGKRKVQPPRIGDNILDSDNRYTIEEAARKFDLAYVLTRIPSDKDDEVPLPSWTGFNTQLCQNVPQLSVVGYLPVIDASPTEIDTVYTVLLRSIEIADKLGLRTVVVVFDQAIYAKAQTVRWQTELFMTRTVIRLGAFHTAMTFMACIGKRFGDGGLRDILIESEICAQGSLKGVLNGHHYNRSIRCHKLIYEALHRLRWQSFLSSLSGDDLDRAAMITSKFRLEYPTVGFKDAVLSDEFSQVYKQYQDFIVSKESSKTFQYWSSYIEMVEILLLFIRATREGDWSLHVQAVRSMCPWMFVTSRINYARYLPAYFLEMSSLEDTHPDVHDKFMKGEFVVQRQTHYGFSQVACDHTIEQTCNRDTKTKGGMIGITQKKGASHRWTLSHPERASITNRCMQYAGKGPPGKERKDLQKSFTRKEEESIASVVRTVEGFLNPFGHASDDLVHIASGMVVPDKIAEDILNAEEKGELAFAEFCQERLISGEKAFHDTIKKCKLQSFGDVGRVMKSRLGSKEMVLKSEINLMARLVIIGKERGIKIEELLKYTLGPMPLPLAYPDGGLVKTNKAKLMHHLEDMGTATTAEVTGTPANAVWILDAMAILQSISVAEIPQTFGQLAAKFLKKVTGISLHNNAKAVHLVSDRYPEVSIKNAERARRSKSNTNPQYRATKIYSKDQEIPVQWKQFLSCGGNKEELVEFFVKCWEHDNHDINLDLTIGHGNVCHQILFSREKTQPEIRQVEELNSTHEEADTRLMCHALFAASTSDKVVIQSPDTDVLVLAISKCKEIPCELYFETGTGNNRRLLNVMAIHEKLCELHQSCPEALIGLHTFTGCDSVSAFHGKGKVKPFKLMVTEDKFVDLFLSLGRSFTLEDSVLTIAEQFVSLLYGQPTNSVNTARALLFKSGKHTDDISLPPNSDSLKYHCLRANYQAAVHRRCLETMPAIPSPDGHGWAVSEEGTLQIKWMDLLPAPDAVLELVNCKCKKSHCRTDMCSCAKNKLPCTEFCGCVDCENRNTVTEDNNVDEDIDEEDSSSDEED